MYQFLCLFGPAAFTWLLRRKYLNQNIYKNIDGHTDRNIEKNQAGKYRKETIPHTLAEIISYAFIQMTVILLVCKPLGRVQLTILSNGRLDIQYGSTAVLVSVCLSAVMGVTAVKDTHKDRGSLGVKEEREQDQNISRRQNLESEESQGSFSARRIYSIRKRNVPYISRKAAYDRGICGCFCIRCAALLAVREAG